MNILVLTSSSDSFNSIRPELEIFISLAKSGHKITLMTQKESAYSARFKEFGIDVIDAEYKKKISF
ncbi:MAG: glycosyltransferase family 1 protein, partial [Sulfurimonas sp.]|nr:glycosyltransferase family 1 protein [Sulfurimonas sp.]